MVRKGQPRLRTSQAVVASLQRAVFEKREIQFRIANYKKNGFPFINILSLIPVPGDLACRNHELHDVAYFVGFQAVSGDLPSPTYSKPRMRTKPTPSPSIPTRLATLLKSKVFLESFPVSVDIVPPNMYALQRATLTGLRRVFDRESSRLSLILHECNPWLAFGISFRTTVFTYVPPAAERILGYSPADLAGKSCDDMVHLHRELKAKFGGQPGRTISVGWLF